MKPIFMPRAQVIGMAAVATASSIAVTLLISGGSGGAVSNAPLGDAVPASAESPTAVSLLQQSSESRGRTPSDVRYSDSAVGQVALGTATEQGATAKQHLCLAVSFRRGGGSVSCRDAHRNHLPFVSVAKVGDGRYSVAIYLPEPLGNPVVVSSDGSATVALRVDEHGLASAELSKDAAGELRYVAADGGTATLSLKGMPHGD
jgi:hypothetical protein